MTSNKFRLKTITADVFRTLTLSLWVNFTHYLSSFPLFQRCCQWEAMDFFYSSKKKKNTRFVCLILGFYNKTIQVFWNFLSLSLPSSTDGQISLGHTCTVPRLSNSLTATWYLPQFLPYTRAIPAGWYKKRSHRENIIFKLVYITAFLFNIVATQIQAFVVQLLQFSQQNTAPPGYLVWVTTTFTRSRLVSK